MLGRDADDRDREADEGGDPDGDQGAGEELEAGGVGGRLAGGRLGRRAVAVGVVAAFAPAAVAVVLDRLRVDEVARA